jgi:hypothetical protein
MARDNKTRFGITAWPGIPLPFPTHVETGTGIGWSLGLLGGFVVEDLEFAPPPKQGYGEVYLRLLTVDLDDEVSMLTFVSHWGTLGVRFTQDPVTGERVERPDYSHLLGPAASRERIEAEIAEDLRRSVETAQQEFDDYFVEETLDEFRFGAWLIHDLTSAWRLLRGEDPPQRWLSKRHRPGYEPNTTDIAAEFLLTDLSPLLAPFSPQLASVDELAGGRGPRTTGPYHEGASLLQGMGLELYNHICEQTGYKACANEACGRLFVRHEGRAKAGQYRTSGVKYCSSSCARAQAQRAYRRRGRPR